MSWDEAAEAQRRLRTQGALELPQLDPSQADITQAAAWRLALDADMRGRPLDVEEWVALTNWLEGAPGRSALLDACEGLDTRPALAGRPRARRFTTPPRPVLVRIAVATAAAAALVVVAAWPRDAITTVEAGASVRSVVLGDGSRILLNRGGRLEARLGLLGRRLRLSAGSQAAFDVVHDVQRPFTVEVDGAAVRVLGTRFDIDDAGDRLTVAVARGVVSVSGGRTAPIQVPAGCALSRSSLGRAELRTVAPDAVSGWTRGELIYRDAPLAGVAADLSRYVGAPVGVDADATSLRFTGALAIDRGPLMVARLTRFLAIEAYRTAAGVRLRSAPSRR